MGNILNIYNMKFWNESFIGISEDDINYNILYITQKEFEKIQDYPNGKFICNNVSLSHAKHQANELKNEFACIYIFKIID